MRLEDRFDDAPGDVTVIVHPSPGWLAAAHPFLPAARLAAAPAGAALSGRLGDGDRSCMSSTTHYLDRRAAGEDSMAALRGTAERLYVQIVVGANNAAPAPAVGARGASFATCAGRG